MRAKEAPEKLYITYNGYGVFEEDPTVERTKDSQTEYTRTDAVIERVIRWIDYNNRNGGCNFDGWGKDIKNYMKGE